ncbi:MAG: c-type cytochrome [Chloroflexota bacterium]
MIKRVLILAVAGAVLTGALLLFTYDLLKIDWIGFMEIQDSFRPMEEPLPVPAGSIPIEGAAYIPGLGAPPNPVEADADSLANGELLFGVNCAQCHGVTGEGNGVIANFLENKKPADLTSALIQEKSDGAFFLTISSGVPGSMPALNENLTVRQRWDVVNYMRTFGP